MDDYGWSEYYQQLVERNIGLVSYGEQEKIRKAKIVLFGVGGQGGRIAEILVRSGCESLTIIDHDKYSISNLSTQFITKQDVGKFKVDVLSDKLCSINPNLTIIKHYFVDDNNISTILEDQEIASLTLDGPIASILVARACRKRNIPIIESWSMPYMYILWFTRESIDYESFYSLDTHALSNSEILNNSELEQRYRDGVFTFLEKFPKFHQYYGHKKNTVEDMRSGKISLRSMAPFVFFTATKISTEMIFTGILGRRKMIIAPEFQAYDVFNGETIMKF